MRVFCMNCSSFSDFCDLYATHEFDAFSHTVPLECICLWYFGNGCRKQGIDWAKVNDGTCHVIRENRRKMEKMPYYSKRSCEDLTAEVSEHHIPLVPTDSAEELVGVGMHMDNKDFVHDMPKAVVHERICKSKIFHYFQVLTSFSITWLRIISQTSPIWSQSFCLWRNTKQSYLCYLTGLL